MLEETTAVLSPPPEAEMATSLLETERMEFQASLQLLADRACWISGALAGAIALKENGVMGYRAVSGTSDREPGTEIAPGADPRRECLEEKRPVRVGPVGEPPTFAIAVPVLRDCEAVGFIELTSGREFTDEMSEALSRLADLVTVTIEHCEAAERAEGFEFDNEDLSPPVPALWHAPEPSAEAANAGAINHGAHETAKVTTPTPAPEIRTCTACGFPVSTGRALCVECERKPESASVPAPLFAAEAEESWLSAHGYTIASLIVTAITAALIVWLRR